MSNPIEELMRITEESIRESRERLNAGDVIQASEKAYKAAEEVIKAIAEKFNLPEYQMAVKEGEWYIYHLSSVASKYEWSRRG
nr:PaREP1 family protein [Caldivirga maquilingensis]